MANKRAWIDDWVAPLFVWLYVLSLILTLVSVLLSPQ
jgi:hypothetical protein